MQVRRVVTGHSPTGKAAFVSDELIDPITVGAMPGYEFHNLWGADSVRRFPDGGEPPEWHEFFPPVGGFRFGLFTLPPEGYQAESEQSGGGYKEIEAKLPGLLRFSERESAGMHRTSTIDFEVVLEGEVTLELDDGARRTLRPGDTVVQNGTRHRWLNLSEAPATYAHFLLGAEHEAFRSTDTEGQ